MSRPTRLLGQILMWLGAGVGGAVGLALLLDWSIPGVPWLVAVGLAKLTLAASVGLLAGGAFLQRLARRQEERPALPRDITH